MMTQEELINFMFFPLLLSPAANGQGLMLDATPPMLCWVEEHFYIFFFCFVCFVVEISLAVCWGGLNQLLFVLLGVDDSHMCVALWVFFLRVAIVS